MTERQGIEIDYCPTCRGVWLDRGELDRIIERAVLERHSGDLGDRKNESYGHHEEKSSNMGILIRKGVFWVICSTKNEPRVAKGVPRFSNTCVALLSVITIRSGSGKARRWLHERVE